jgi:predicted nuclease with TOPRIM domain
VFSKFWSSHKHECKECNEKLQRVAKEKRSTKSEHKQKQKEEVELLIKKEIEEELRKSEHDGVLNIQLLVVKSLSHPPSSLECEGKMYNEKMQFALMIIHDIYKIRTFVVEFLRRHKISWHASEQEGP